MKSPFRTFFLVLLLLHGLPGCGFEPTVIVPTLSVCGMACVDGLKVESRLDLTFFSVFCDAEFELFKEKHPSSVCGHAYEVVFASKCVGATILGAALTLVCMTVCSEVEDIQTCTLDCLLEELPLEGNCIRCYVEKSVDLRLCLLKPGITSEEISTCASQYIVQTAKCTP